MPSKFYPWDFKTVRPEILKARENGVFLFHSGDAELERFFLGRLRKRLDQDQQSYQIVMGGDLKADWLIETFTTQSLFFSQESLIILSAELLSKEVRNALKQLELADDPRFILLCVSGKLGNLDELTKEKHITHFALMMPPPWEEIKLLDYLASELSYPLPHLCRQYLLEAIDHTVADFVQAIRLLKLHCPDPLKLTASHWIELLPSKRLEQFQWGVLFAQKKKRFFHELAEKDLDDKELMIFFKFMQSYLLKMMDQSYLQKKKSPSKFDREIQTLALNWGEKELQGALHLFAELEILAKRKDPWLSTRLRQEYLKRV